MYLNPEEAVEKVVKTFLNDEESEDVIVKQNEVVEQIDATLTHELILLSTELEKENENLLSKKVLNLYDQGVYSANRYVINKIDEILKIK